jgi:phosphoribosylformimino-5-aminoimidazole carboxamide ribonucleotide (ProFAR) isomerase
MDAKSEKDHARTVAVQTPDPMDKITDFYKSQLASKGWKIESTMTMAQMNSFIATKEGHKLVISITTDGKMQQISQSLADH